MTTNCVKGTYPKGVNKIENNVCFRVPSGQVFKGNAHYFVENAGASPEDTTVKFQYFDGSYAPEGTVSVNPCPAEVILAPGSFGTAANLVCIRKKDSDDPTQLAWISGVLSPGSDSVAIKLFSLDGQDELSLDDYLINK